MLFLYFLANLYFSYGIRYTLGKNVKLKGNSIKYSSKKKFVIIILFPKKNSSFHRSLSYPTSIFVIN